MPLSIYASVNRMAPKLLDACPGLETTHTAVEYGADRLMYDLGHYVIARVKAGQSSSLIPLAQVLEEALAESDAPVRSTLSVFIGCVAASGSLNDVSPEPFRLHLGERGKQFWQETVDFYNNIGPLRYEEGTY